MLSKARSITLCVWTPFDSSDTRRICKSSLPDPVHSFVTSLSAWRYVDTSGASKRACMR